MTAYTQHDYEAIEAAVLESPRGRWFLGEYTRRNRAADTLTLLEAIGKLERGMAESAAASSPDRLSDDLVAGLHRLSETIEAALSRISHTQDVWGAVTEVPEDAPDDVLIDQVRGAVEQLFLVRRQIDALLAAQSDGAEAADGGTLSDENLSFFEGDEDLFDPVPEADVQAPSLVVVAGEEQGHETADAADSGSGPEPEQTPKPGPNMKADPKRDPRDRIVFIRRGSSDEMSIPLAEETEPVPAGRSQPGS